jgi:deoxyhypusine synthase
MEDGQNLIELSKSNVIKESSVEAKSKLSQESHEIRGYDMNKGIDFSSILDSYLTTGFQATNFARACEEINRMV